MSELSVNPEQLGAYSGEFDELADNARNIHNDLASSLEELGDFAGGDMTGKRFSGQFGPGILAAHLLLEGFDDTMRRAGDDLKGTARLFQASNAVNTGIAGKGSAGPAGPVVLP